MSNTVTYAEVADRTNIAIPPHLEAQAEVPFATNGWRQGDVYVLRFTGNVELTGKPESIEGVGVAVVRGEADRNSHVLNGDGVFYRQTVTDARLDYGVLVVPEGGTAVLTHTAEHGSVAFGEGTWHLRGQASFETEMRRAAD